MLEVSRTALPFIKNPRVTSDMIPPKYLIKRINKICPHLITEWWNCGQNDVERGVNPAWRLVRVLGPHYWSHVTWIPPGRMDFQLIYYLDKNDLFRHYRYDERQIKIDFCNEQIKQWKSKEKNLQEKIDERADYTEDKLLRLATENPIVGMKKKVYSI